MNPTTRAGWLAVAIVSGTAVLITIVVLAVLNSKPKKDRDRWDNAHVLTVHIMKAKPYTMFFVSRKGDIVPVIDRTIFPQGDDPQSLLELYYAASAKYPEVRTLGKEIKVILTAGHLREIVSEKMADGIIDGYLNKPSWAALEGR